MINMNPGSDEAVNNHGCTCAVIDNNYGRGFTWGPGGNKFWISADCPLHGVKDERTISSKSACLGIPEECTESTRKV